jgi:hypothetical protein
LRFGNLTWFLREVCGAEERSLVLHILLPTMASLALSLQQCKPFIGQYLRTKKKVVFLSEYIKNTQGSVQ